MFFLVLMLRQDQDIFLLSLNKEMRPRLWISWVLMSKQHSRSQIPTMGCNPIIGCTSNYWMQKHPIVGCSNLCKAIADSRSHWEVAPYAQPAVQAINKYFNQTSNFYKNFPKITNCIHKSLCIMAKHPIVGCFELCILFYKLKYIFWEDISL